MIRRQARRQLLAALGLACAAAAPLCCRRYVHPAPEGGGVAASQPAKPRTTQPAAAAARPPDSAPTPANAPTAKMIDYENKQGGFRLQYPSNWKPRADPDYTLHLAPANGSGNRNITFDVADVPIHIPGMVTTGRMEHGYLDNLRKKHGQVKIEESTDQSVAGAKARLVRSSWSEAGHSHTQITLLIAHAEGAFVLSADADTADFPKVKDDFDKVAKSVQWTK